MINDIDEHKKHIEQMLLNDMMNAIGTTDMCSRFPSHDLRLFTSNGRISDAVTYAGDMKEFACDVMTAAHFSHINAPELFNFVISKRLFITQSIQSRYPSVTAEESLFIWRTALSAILNANEQFLSSPFVGCTGLSYSEWPCIVDLITLIKNVERLNTASIHAYQEWKSNEYDK